MTRNTTFAVELPSRVQDPNGFYKKGLVNAIKSHSHLTVAGIDDPFCTRSGKYIRGIDYAGAGSVITFGTAKNHDVNWVERPDYAREKGYAPVYNLAKDYSKVISTLNTFAAERKPAPVRYSTKVDVYGDYRVNPVTVEVFDNFTKIGNQIIQTQPSNVRATRTYTTYSAPRVVATSNYMVTTVTRV